MYRFDLEMLYLKTKEEKQNNLLTLNLNYITTKFKLKIKVNNFIEILL